MTELFTDEYFMQLALREARTAFDLEEVPVGAVIVARNQIISKAHNQVQLLNDVTAHAEILAITSAEQSYGAKYLTDCTLYVTLEPCVMCAGALRWAQIGRIVYGASDDKNGFMRFGKDLLHPTTKLSYGVCHDEAMELMQNFFAQRRSRQI